MSKQEQKQRPSQQQPQQSQPSASSQPKGNDAQKEKKGIKIQRPSGTNAAVAVSNPGTKDSRNTGSVNNKRKYKKQPPAEEKAPEEGNGQKRKLRIVRKTVEAKPGWKAVEATKPFSQILLEDTEKK